MAWCQRCWKLPTPLLLQYPLMTPQSFPQKQAVPQETNSMKPGSPWIPGERIGTGMSSGSCLCYSFSFQTTPQHRPFLPGHLFYETWRERDVSKTCFIVECPRLILNWPMLSTSVLQPVRTVTAWHWHLSLSRKPGQNLGCPWAESVAETLLENLPQQPLLHPNGWCWVRDRMVNAAAS